MRWIVLLLIAIFITGCTGGEAPDVGKETTALVVHEEVEEEEGPIEVFLPGTQPDVVSFERVSFCKFCHGDYAEYAPYDTWKGTMMGNAMRDPIFLAAVASNNKDFDGIVLIGDYCLRCHTPKGWLEGRSEPPDGSSLVEAEDDFEGIICDFCHRAVDPLSSEGKGLETNGTVETQRNAQYVVSDDTAKRGPYEPTPTGHVSKYSEFHTTSEFCATCHEITNPLYNNEEIEKTYTEWKYSAYGDYAEGEKTSCQSCHMPTVEGYACNVESKILRDDIYKHEFAGGNACMQDIMKYIYGFTDETHLAALETTQGNAKEMLGNAAKLELTNDEKKVEVKIINLAGHKLPTGFSEGRSMWINVKFYDSGGNIVKESGAYDFDTGELAKDAEIKVYEIKPGIKNTGDPESFPDLLGLPDGPSFHFAANNYIYKDNRIPPTGFKNSDFEEYKAYIRDATYKDGQDWDLTGYMIPDGAVSADVTLYYQTTSKEFIEFLYEENKGNKWDYFGMGEKLYEAWQNTGRCAPVAMEKETIELS